MPLESINPATGEVVRTLTPLDDAGVQQRLSQAALAAAQQRTLPLEHRVLCLRKLAALLQEERDDVSRLLTTETGKPVAAARMEVDRCIDACRYHAENAVRLLAPEVIPSDSGQSYVQWSPVGAVLAVISGQSPAWHSLRFAVPALLAGNVVLLKLAPGLSQIALSIEALIRRAGFSRGALTALLIEERMVESVFADDRVAAVTVTGPQTAGRALAAQAGWLLKKVTVHLPASDPMIIMASAELEAAVAAAVRGFSTGDGARRIIVESSVYGDVVRRLTSAMEGLRVGDPMREETEVGPVGTAEAAALAVEQIEAAVAAGGRIVSGGARLVGRGNFLEPTLLSDVPRTAAVSRDALAGPVALVFRARDVQDAIAIANTAPNVRHASVWTKEPAEQQQLIVGVDAGSVALNTGMADDPRLPVGGGRRAGYGRELGMQGIREFLSAKTVSIG